jgi:hypothetical protein
MNKTISLTFLALLIIGMIAGCDKMLTKPPLDQATDKTFWNNEKDIKTFAFGFYPHFFSGYGSGYTGGKFFSYIDFASNWKINDTYGYLVPPKFSTRAPSSSADATPPITGDTWSNGYAYVRKANLFINRVKNSPIDETAKKKWIGIGRFFRALEYQKLVLTFGDVPYYSQVLKKDENKKLYKKRTPRTQVADSMLADFQYAAQNVPPSTGAAQLTVNKYVILAFESRAMLFQGSWLYYHKMGKNQEAEKFLKAAKDAAMQIIKSGNYSITSNYRKLFNSEDLSGNPGIILYRKYQTGVTTHSMNAYSDYTPQTGINKDGYDAYLMDDGLPPDLSPEWKGDKSISALFKHRDPRFDETFIDTLRLNGEISNYSSTGISQKKFLNEQIVGQTAGTAPYNNTDSPVMRYGEVLLNYAEATAILAQMGQSTLTQHDLDISINKLRDRPGINMPHLQIMGNMPAVNGKTYDDPKRDPDVSPIMWEIRRERRIELMMEGFRFNDLRRWNKLDKADDYKNPVINRGVYIDLSKHPDAKDAGVQVAGGGSKGYIIPSPKSSGNLRRVKDRDYLSPLPIDQIDLYKKHGITLKQNPGW